MKITMLGAGSMGSLFGGLLAEQGYEVTLVDVDEAVLSAIKANGLRLENDEGERWIRPLSCCRPEDLQAPIEWLWVFTKSPQTVAALASVQNQLTPKSWVMSLQNGLGNLAKLATVVPESQILIGTTTWPADKPGPGHVVTHGQGVIQFMAADGRLTEETEVMVNMLNQAGLQATVGQDVWATIWAKVAFNCALNCLCTVLNTSVDQLGRLPDGEALAFEVVAEVAAVAAVQGIRIDQAAVQATARHAIGTHTGHLPSMLQDWRHGRPTEIEALNGEVVAQAEQYQVAVPLTAALLGLVRLLSEIHKEGV